jgi:hypothetical protein
MSGSYKISYTEPLLEEDLFWLPVVEFCSTDSSEKADEIATTLLKSLNHGSTVYISNDDNIKVCYEKVMTLSNINLQRE